MLKSVVWVGVLVFAVSALSGCLSGSPPAPQANLPDDISVVVLDEGTGALVGHVVDPDGNGLDQVKVGLLRSEGNPILAQTNAEGDFEVRGLAPGSYEVAAMKDEYQPAPPTTVVIDRGILSQVTITLTPNPNPFRETLRFAGYIQEHVCATVNTRAASAADFCHTSHGGTPSEFSVFVNETSRGPLEALIVEITWTPKVSTCSPIIRPMVYAPQPTKIGSKDTGNTADPTYWDGTKAASKSPVRLLIVRNGTEDAMHAANRTTLNEGKPIQTNGLWRVAFEPEAARSLGTPIDVSCAVDQTLDIYVTTFYNEPAPENWSALSSA